MSRSRRVLFRAAGVLLLASVLAPPPRLVAQDPVPRGMRMPDAQGVSQDEILRRFAESGLSREEVKRQLRQMGYDPLTVDAYFDRLDGATGDSIPEPSSAFVEALREMGLIGELEFRRDTLALGLRPGDRVDTLGFTTREPSSGGLDVFGLDVFSRPTTAFDVLATGPVDASYRVAPGDWVRLIVTGDAELAYNLRVDREGYIVIPDIGRVLVNGLTMSGLEERLNTQMARRLSGIDRGTTQVAVSLGELRTNQVYVIGEVRWPGAYDLSSLATVFHALHEAGGPTREGSFRTIHVRREGQLVREIDLYRYLVEGDANDDIRLLQGDIVFVPLAGPQVAMTGEVNRSAIFELREGEGLREALAFAGGFRAGARTDQLHVYRILPPALRTGSAQDRVLVDVALTDLLSADMPLPLFDADSIVVRGVRAERANVVTVEGQVTLPGPYQYRDGMTVGDLLARAGGLLPDAFRPVAHVIRLNPADSTYGLVRTSLELGPGGAPLQDLALLDQDRVVVYGTPSLELPRVVSIEGFVKQPGSYLLREGMTVEDLVLTAGGFREGAQGLEAEVSRLRIGLERSDTMSSTTVVALSGTLPWPHDGTIVRGQQDDDGLALPRGDEYRLASGDRVFVRQLPGYVEAASVQIVGEVMNPGPYPVRLRDERLSSFLRRAGGLTTEAYIEGARLVRDSILVGIDLARAMEDPRGSNDLILEDGDRLEVPRFDPMVTVLGAVAFESRVPYREGWGLGDYLAQAGGTLHEADRDRVSVEYPNGQRAISRKTLWVRRDPPVRPGSIVRVSYATEDVGLNWSGFLSTSLSITTTLVTLLLAINQL